MKAECPAWTSQYDGSSSVRSWNQPVWPPSGPNAQALPEQFRRLKSRNRDLFNGISGYVARSSDRARLLIGPFRGPSDAQIFAEDLQTVGIESFSWTNSESEQIVPVGTE